MRKRHSQYAPKFGDRRNFSTGIRSKSGRSKSKAKAALSQCTEAVLETLENRTLLSTSIAVVNGVLTLTGDPVLATSLVASLNSDGKNIGVSAGQGHVATIPLSSVNAIKITGGSGNDTIYVTSTLKLPTTIVSGNGNDSINGGGGDQNITAGDGADWINVRGDSNLVKVGNGNSTILGGAGNDTIIAGNGNLSVDGGTGGNDSITLGNGNDTVSGEAGNDTIVAGNGADCLAGGLGDDKLVAGTGISTFLPGMGNNIVQVGNPKDIIIPSSGVNSIVDGSGKLIAGNASNTSIPVPLPGWTAYSAPSSSDSTAPRAIMEVLAPAPIVGIGVDVRALDSTLGAGSPITANYQWDFGDPSGEYNNLPGYNAAHVYQNPGTYTIKLTITNELGKSSSVSQQLTIGADNRKVIYVDASAGNDSNNGLSPTSAIRTVAKADSMVRNDTEILFHRGQTFGTTAAFLAPYSNVLVGAYGSGDNPIIQQSQRINYSVLFSTQTNSWGITISDLQLDLAGEASDPYNQTGEPDGFHPRGADIVIQNITFKHVQSAINANSDVTGLTVIDCNSTDHVAIQGYFVWSQGTDTALLGNTIADSIHQHTVRTSGASEILVADNNFTNTDGKGCIEIHDGSYAWIQSNSVTGGDIRVGPLGGTGEPVTSATDYAVIDGNTVNGPPINVYPGSHHISIRNNVIYRTESRLIAVRGQDTAGRQSSDIRILNNTGFSTSDSGSFLVVESHTNGIILQNNLFIQPNLKAGGNAAAPVYVFEDNLSSFTSISNNIWPMPATIYLFGQGGINYVGKSYVSAGYLTPAAWNALSVVGTDLFSNISVSGITPSSSSLAAGGGTPALGVFDDFYGKARPGSGGKWTIGAVQL